MIGTDLGWIAHRLLSGSGWGVAMKVEVHFDESGTDAREITLAGYMFEADRFDSFASEWLAILREHDLPFFHMVDCAHGNRPFHNLHKNQRVRLQMRLMSVIKRYSINGIVCNILNKKENSGASYLEAVCRSLEIVAEWAENTTFEGKIAYFFEAGANGRHLVDARFGEIATDLGKRNRHRFAGHAFLPKDGNPGVQAADFLAWQYHNFTKKRKVLDLPRLDFRSLLRHPHSMVDDCGELPSDSTVRSIGESRRGLETVLYLPHGTTSRSTGCP